MPIAVGSSPQIGIFCYRQCNADTSGDRITCTRNPGKNRYGITVHGFISRLRFEFATMA